MVPSILAICCHPDIMGFVLLWRRLALLDAMSASTWHLTPGNFHLYIKVRPMVQSSSPYHATLARSRHPTYCILLAQNIDMRREDSTQLNPLPALKLTHLPSLDPRSRYSPRISGQATEKVCHTSYLFLAVTVLNEVSRRNTLGAGDAPEKVVMLF